MKSGPGLARWLVRVAAGEALADAIEGDLEEEFHNHILPGSNRIAASLWYWRQVLGSLGPILLRRWTRYRRLPATPTKRENPMGTLLQDLRFSLRSIRKHLGFSVVVIATLALGIGANTILYSIVDGLVLHPFPFPDEDRIVTVGTEYPRLGTGLNFIEHMSPAEYMDIRDGTRTLENVVAWDMGNRQVSFGEMTDNLFTGFWWGDAFEPIGITPFMGRGMTLEETLEGDRVAVLSHRVWSSRFGADPDIIGKTFGLNGNPYEVVGIMPPRSELAGMDLWMPMGVGPEVFSRNRRQFQVLARVREGVAMEQVNTELEALARRTELEHAREMEEYVGWRMTAYTWTEANVRTLKPAAYTLMGAVAFVLLLVCSNVASLLLARSSTRRREMAVRTAMGAGRGRLVRQMLTESVTLAVVGGVFGLALAKIGTDAAAAILGAFPFVSGTVELNTRVLLFTAGIAVAAGILFGLMPALQGTSAGVQATLKTEGTAVTGSRKRLGLQRLFVGIEVALALMLLVGGGLLISSMARLNAVETGFNPDNVLTMRLTLPREEYDGPAVDAFFQILEEQVSAIPGVETVGRGDQFPPVAFAFRRMATEGLEVTGEGQLPVALATVASPGYFDALGVPIEAGRAFTDLDAEGAPGVALVNRAAVDLLFESEDPIGQRIRTGGEEDSPWFEVVGVAGNTVNVGPDQPPFPQVFVNHRQTSDWANQMYLIVRTAVDPYTVLPNIRSTVRELDADQPVYQIRTAQEALAASTAPRQLAANVLTMFAAFALALAAVGIFAVVTFAVGERTREIGLRIALGAQSGDVRKLVVKQALVPVVLGAIAGLGGAMALSRLMGQLLFEVSGTDPMTLLLVTLVFGAVAVTASYLPARARE